MNDLTRDSLEKTIEHMINDSNFRKKLVYESPMWFFVYYFSRLVKYETAEFQREMFELSADDTVPFVVFEAFRGCGKSTIVSFSYVIWSILCNPQKKFILLVSETQGKANQFLRNVKVELETNKALIKDFGPFPKPPEPWKANTLSLPKYNALITSISSGTSPRGITHMNIRPDLIICDDVESFNNVSNSDIRKKIFNWFMGEVKPAGDLDTKLIVIGNYLHRDSLISRLKEKIDKGEMAGVYRKYPFSAESGGALWKGKFPSQESIDRFKKSVGDERAWQREYLLNEVSEDDSPIKCSYIRFYDKLPTENYENDIKLQFVGTGVDLAITEKERSDYTAMVSAKVFWIGSEAYIYILPNPINIKMNFNKTLEMAQELSLSLSNNKYRTMLFVENVAYQQALVDMLLKNNFNVEGVSTNRMGKRERLVLTTNLFTEGRILFPREGADELIEQLLNFGIDRHDDLVDAFVILVTKIKERCKFDSPRWNLKPEDNAPVYRNIGGEKVDMSKPITSGMWSKKF